MKTLIKPKQLSEIEKNLDDESLRKITGGEGCGCKMQEPEEPPACGCLVSEPE